MSTHIFATACVLLLTLSQLGAAELLAGAAKVDITDRGVPLVNDPCHARALVMKSGGTTVAFVSVDAVAIGEIGRIGNGFLGTVRGQLQKELGIPPGSVLVNASHFHGVVRSDTAEL